MHIDMGLITELKYPWGRLGVCVCVDGWFVGWLAKLGKKLQNIISVARQP